MEEDLIKDGELLDKSMTPVPESIVQFKMLSDRTVYEVVSEKNNETMVRISGYDLDISFNMEHINCIEDIEAACNGISQLFREIITEKLLEHKQKP